MTAGNNGTGTPQDDDPFAYLYRSEGGADGDASAASQPARQAQEPQRHQPGVPRTSYHHVRAVGERTYGQQQAHSPQPSAAYGRTAAYGTRPDGVQRPDGRTAAYGPQAARQEPPGDSPSPHYAAPETLGGAPRPPAPPHGRGRAARRTGPNPRGLLIGAITVVAVVVAGIGVAMITNSGGGKAQGAAPTSAPPSSTGSAEPTRTRAASPTPAPLPPPRDAATLRLDGVAATANQIPGAKAAGGTYVTGLNVPGAAVTWTVDVKQKGDYRLYVRYGIPGKPANATVTVNSKLNAQPLGMKNFTGSPEGDWEKGWQTTWAPVTLNAGTNVVRISCEQGNQCDAVLDQVWLKTP
ncbi:carbohydrate-binding protein [Streptomyces sp. B1866]|uniref:CBM35 domain-containing protein n=1 Tax=Streptomyces sp. B1866 TaxID=3075431 RepID=UPI00288E3AC3|nr:carbohydrate-binding protein [Streptomyces sp. B1866]MDT3395945.1 carbohydrate-binding protein [Streptomyces sp. B1866]